MSTYLHAKKVSGTRLFAMSNAGMESVGMADSTKGRDYEISLPKLSDELRERLVYVLRHHKLDRLVNPRNPLDVTPMADEAAYEDVARLMLESPEIDAAIISCVPLAPQLKTLAEELDYEESFVKRLPALFASTEKPLVFVVDSGDKYDALSAAVREQGVPVFRSADQAVAAMGRYLVHRGPKSAAAALPEPALVG
jgi:acyl-CoA synthetase (NDP forming)